MSRLLFAAARGARIQINGFSGDTLDGRRWYDSIRWSAMPESMLRIHPDDEHLQYGLVSTELRESAETGKSLSHIAWGATMDETGLPMQFFENGDHRSMFLLLLAEKLADLGS